MAFVLIVHEEDRDERIPLAPGTQLVGSSPACEVRIGHPTVSRRHARLEVTESRVEVVDLDSSNGTLLDGRRIAGSSTVDAGAKLGFGSINTTLESVADRDLEPGIVFTRAAPPSRPPVGDAEIAEVATTAAVGSMRTFALDQLPGLVRRLEQGADLAAMAQAAGAALAAALPVAQVTISGREIEGRGRGILFSSGDARPDEELPQATISHRLVELRATFRHESQASGYRPLLDAASRLIGLGARQHRAKRSPEGEPFVPRFPDPPTIDPAMRRLYDDATRIAQGDVSVLICGESGTGKEVFARYLHAASPRREEAFIALNCAALPADLLESELFGIESGVATGVDSRAGKFEDADGGTLFLDEVGDMAPETQAKILRVVQEGEVYRLGAREPRPARARIVAATNRDLDALRHAGDFRSDLYHRIADWRVKIPALRHRAADIPNLAAYFLLQAAAKRGVEVLGLSKAALDVLVAYRWPGNIRQLEREMARAVLFLENGELLRADHLAPEIRVAPDGPTGQRLQEILAAAERQALRAALDATGGNMTVAAKRLGIGRSTLYRRLREHGLASDASTIA